MMPMQTRILVIDDSEVVLTRMKMALMSAGYEVMTTNQTVGAARFLKNCDLVIIDYHMPGLNGSAVVKSLKSALAAMDRVPLFYVYTSDESVENTCRTLGFDGSFVRKGDLSALVPQVQAALRLYQLVKRTRNKGQR